MTAEILHVQGDPRGVFSLPLTWDRVVDTDGEKEGGNLSCKRAILVTKQLQGSCFHMTFSFFETFLGPFPEACQRSLTRVLWNVGCRDLNCLEVLCVEHMEIWDRARFPGDCASLYILSEMTVLDSWSDVMTNGITLNVS